jgi:hypothetical protein
MLLLLQERNLPHLPLHLWELLLLVVVVVVRWLPASSAV